MDARVIAAAVIIGALVAWAVWFAARAWRLWREKGTSRVVTCPETGESALVTIDVALAVTGNDGSAQAPLCSCSRWDERGRCEQPCLQHAHDPGRSPAALVRAWADGRACATCGHPLKPSRFGGHQPALLQPDGTTREWAEVPAVQLPLALATSLPVCWNCHVASTFRRQHPELVTDRDI